MPIENKELTRQWKIVFLDLIEHSKTLGAMARFEITSPDGKEMFSGIIFTRNFIDDYFGIPGVGDITGNRIKILEEKKELFKIWALVRLEEAIDENYLEKDIRITSDDFQWADKVKTGILQPASNKLEDNSYIYIPERKIGFK
jgi:hypothetical protein